MEDLLSPNPADGQTGLADGQTGPAQGPAETYQVFARKYRPRSFEELIGQTAMVRILSNAFKTGRIAQAFMLTGVRGVGKTSTARIIAKALNCVGPDGTGGPTAAPCGACEPCRAIAQDRFIDVLEMDAASRTGVDDIRELIDSIPYLPVQARNKVYIIDEVHMLSRNAFNALLKSLEEPPSHVKFVFATTEIRKVPVTVLSRCQRFDLRRVETAVLIPHFQSILDREGLRADDAALALVARAAEGSVRDGLSLLDQAATHADGSITADIVRTMLGLADRGLLFDLFDHLMAGRLPEALGVWRGLYTNGADPASVVEELLEICHRLSTLKLVSADAGEAVAVPETERSRGAEIAAGLSIVALSRSWQMLLKSLGEIRAAPDQAAALEMGLIRLGYAADLPDPADLVRRLSATDAAPAAPAEAAPAPQSYQEIVSLLKERGELTLAATLQNSVRLVSFAVGKIVLSGDQSTHGADFRRLADLLRHWTGQNWAVIGSAQSGAPTLAEQRHDAERERRLAADRHPLVQAAKELFPGAEIKAIRKLTDEPGRAAHDG